MANLKAVNETLLSQNEILRDTQKSVLSTNNLLSKTLESQLKAASMAKLKDLEKDREGGRFSRVAGGLSAAGGAIKGGAEKGLGNIQGMLGKIGSFLTPAALMALPGILAGVLLKRGIPALAVGIFADEIAGFLLGPEASAEMKNQVTRAIQGGALGSLLGKKFALIGAAAGFLIDDEVAAQLLELGKSFGNLLGADIANLDDLKGVMLSIGTFLRETLKGGLDGINDLLNGRIAEFFGIGEGENKVFKTLGLIAGLGLVLAPGATLGAMGFLGKKTLGLGIKALTLLWGKVPAVLRGLGLLGTAITASAGVGTAGAAGAGAAASRGGTLLKIAGGMLRFAGPLGAIIGIATIGYAVGEWFKTTEMYKDLAEAQKKREDESVTFNKVQQAQLDAGASPEDAATVARFATNAGQGQDFTLQAKSTDTKFRTGELIGSDTFMARVAQLEKFENLQGADKFAKTSMGKELEERRAALLALQNREAAMKAPKPTSGESLRNETALGNAPPGQPMIVDGSTNTTQNIRQSNTTLSAPPPAAGQSDDYSGALNSRMNLSTSGYLN